MANIKRPKTKEELHPTAQQEYKEETGHFAKNLETAKEAYNPNDLSEEKKNKQHQAIYLSKHGLSNQ